ncbi:MAG: hypothetical protein V2A70_05005 [Candidatus Omnitrophota bacterium]
MIVVKHHLNLEIRDAGGDLPLPGPGTAARFEAIQGFEPVILDIKPLDRSKVFIFR